MKAMISRAEMIMYQTLPVYMFRVHHWVNQPFALGSISCAIVPGNARKE